MYKILLFSFLLLTQVFLSNNAYGQDEKHPRGLITSAEVLEIRNKVQRAPYSKMIENILGEIERLNGSKEDVYKLSDLTKLQAFMYLVSEDKSWAKEAWENFSFLARDTLFVSDPFSKGLTRAYILREMALAYDFCFDAWSVGQRQFANEAIYDLMSSVNNNMGNMANYHIESNWMGVRYGSVVLAANILDQSLLDRGPQTRKINPFKWDSRYRLYDHIKAAYTDNGWFVETLGYHMYDWTFVAPALISLQNSTTSGAFELRNFVPNQVQALDQHLTATLSIPNGYGRGLKPDLGDDNMNTAISHFAFGVRLMSEAMKPQLKWMVEYVKDLGQYQDDFLILALCPEALDSQVPGPEYLNYVDTLVGVTLFRDRFQDENDIVACFNTSAKRFPGHKAPDNLTFRILGLGGAWAIGAGRTGSVAGQTNLFPGGDPEKEKQKNYESEFLGYSFDQGMGFAAGKGSCMGVTDHTRQFIADYSGKDGARAVFVVKDESEDGKVWRLNTPGFNEVKLLKDGFLLTAPNGASMKARVVGEKKVDVSVNQVRYGGTTVANNTGIGFGSKRYEHSKAIDISCDGDITVVMTLQPAGKDHPLIEIKDSYPW